MLKLYKGDLPASSGGRLASVLDVRIREGNSKQLQPQGRHWHTFKQADT